MSDDEEATVLALRWAGAGGDTYVALDDLLIALARMADDGDGEYLDVGETLRTLGSILTTWAIDPDDEDEESIEEEDDGSDDFSVWLHLQIGSWAVGLTKRRRRR